MTYTPLPLSKVNDLWTETDFNTYYKDNFDAGTGIVTTKGDLLVATESQVADRLPVGTNDQVLTANSGESMGVKWDSSNGKVQTGMIILWSGSTGSIPSGWVICDGNNSTPDLRNRFVVGAGSTYAVDATGGSTTLDISHTHTMAGVTSDGTHSHTLTFGTEDAHTHTVGPVDSGVGSAAELAFTGSGVTLSTGDHTHQFPTESPAPAATHTHGKTFPSEADHTHTLTGASGQASDTSMPTLPPYYALAYIMKVAA